VPDCYAHS
jgi:hypothetical protein